MLKSIKIVTHRLINYSRDGSLYHYCLQTVLTSFVSVLYREKCSGFRQHVLNSFDSLDHSKGPAKRQECFPCSSVLESSKNDPIIFQMNALITREIFASAFSAWRNFSRPTKQTL